MTNTNDELEEWLLRDKLQLAKRELLTYAKVQSLGFDSVKVTNVGDGIYSMDIAGNIGNKIEDYGKP